MSTTKERVIWAGAVATLGVGFTGVGEFLLHYAPNGWGDTRQFAFLATVTEQRLTWGHFLAVLAVPSYFLGYWHVTQALRPSHPLVRRVFFGTSVYVFTMAAVWLGSRAWLAQVVQARASSDAAGGVLFAGLIDDYHRYLESLLWVLRGGVAVLSIVFVYLVLRHVTSYPRWFAAFNPITLLLLVFLTLLVPAVGSIVVPAAMNVVHLVFFGISTWLVARRPLRLAGETLDGCHTTFSSSDSNQRSAP